MAITLFLLFVLEGMWLIPTVFSQTYTYPPGAMNSNPDTFTGSAATAGTYTLTYSSVYSSDGSPIYDAFDSSSSTYFHFGLGNYNTNTGIYTGSKTTTTVDGTTYSGDYLQIKMPFSIYISSYQMTGRDGMGQYRMPRNSALLGSSDCSNWYLVQSETDVQDWTDAAKTFTISSVTTAYTCYRMVALRLGNSDYVTKYQNAWNIAEWAIYGFPEYAPTGLPTSQPSRQPSRQPTSQPSRQPSSQPTSPPTNQPTGQPVVHPTGVPSSQPSMQPSGPTSRPSSQPSIIPSIRPSAVPTTMQPSSVPTASPTLIPSSVPSTQPSSSPSLQPSSTPTIMPSSPPTTLPTTSPSTQPSSCPSVQPSSAPTVTPSSAPSKSPTSKPSSKPVGIPSSEPSASPTTGPSTQPSSCPSMEPTVVPTLEPSRQPTSQPTYSPTSLAANIVRISYIRSTVLRTSVDINAEFTTRALFGGTLYCNVRNSPLSADMSFVFNGATQTYPPFVRSVNISISGLAALRRYYVACGLRSKNGMVSDSQSMVETLITIDTPCCHAISETTRPKYLFADSEYYKRSINAGKNVFVWSLESLPNSVLTLTPQLFYRSTAGLMMIPTANASFIPNEIQLNPNSISTSITFGLFPLKLLTGEVEVQLALSGNDATNYQILGGGSVINILSVESEPLTPTLQMARLSDEGSFISIQFDLPINRGITGAVPSFPCSELFTFAGVDRARCSWQSKTIVIALLGGDSTVTVGSVLNLKGGLLSSECLSTAIDCASYERVAACNISIQSPLNPPKPTVVLTSPSAIASCATAVSLDATGCTGNAGKNWNQIVWLVTDGNGARISSVTQYLNMYYSITVSDRITIPTTLLQPGVYVTTLTLTNTFGLIGSGSSTFTFGADGNTPMVSIGGPSVMEIQASSAFKLFANVVLAPCGNASLVAYQWLVFRKIGSTIVETDIKSTTKNVLVFGLPGYRLAGGSTYVVRIVASNIIRGSSGNIAYNASAETIIAVRAGVLRAVIKGSSTRYISQSTVLDASNSYDEVSEVSRLGYVWTCQFGSGERFGSSCTNDVGMGNETFGPTISVSYDRLVSDVSYVFVVRVWDIDNVERDVSSASVELMKLSTLQTASAQIFSTSAVLNYGTSQTISSFIQSTTDVIAEWEALIDGQRQYIQTGTLTSRYFHLSDVSNGINFPLMIQNIDLPGGALVDLRLSIYDATSEISLTKIDQLFLPNQMQFGIQRNQGLSMQLPVLALVQMTIKVNIAPQSGVLSISPATGYALETEFLVSTYNWQDDPTDFPLSYDFRYSVDNGERFLFLKTQSTFSSTSTYLPGGLQSYNSTVVIVVQVYDIYQATSVVDNFINVYPTIISSESLLTTLLNNMVASAVILKDTDLQVNAVNAISSTMNIVNCSRVSTQYCASIGRHPCVNTAQTCSMCFANFSGIIGDSNTICRPINTGNLLPLGAACNAHQDCVFNMCSEEGKCSAPEQLCPVDDNGLECGGSDRGNCEYIIGGRQVRSTECSVIDTACRPRCSCFSDYGGSACQLSSDQAMIRSAVREDMCRLLTESTTYHDSSSTIIGSVVSSLNSVFDANDVITVSGKEACKDSLMTLLNASTDDSGASYFDMTSPSTATTFVTVLSKFAVLGNATFLNNATSTFVSAALGGMAHGQADMMITSDNLNLRLSRALVSDVITEIQTVPQSSAELAYGKLPVSMQFTEDGASCDDGSGYLSMSMGTFSSVPYETKDTNQAISSLLRLETIIASDTTAVKRRLSNGPQQSAYYISFPFSQQQQFTNSTYETTDINGHAVVIRNETIPQCTQYFDGASIESKECSGCTAAYFSNDTVTFSCVNIANVCNSAFALRKLAVDDDTSKTDDYYASSLDQQAKNTVYQTAAVGKAVASTFVAVLSIDPFAIDVEQAKGILAFVGSLVVLSMGGLLFFGRWDRQDKEYFLKHRTKALMDRVNNFAMTEHLDIVGEDIAELVSKRLKGMIMRSMPIEIEEVSQMSFFKRYFVHPFLQHHEYFLPAGKPSLVNTRTTRWTSFCFAALLTMFLDTLFYSTFYADNGTCESYLDETSCLSEPNSVGYGSSTKCLWDAENGCSLAPPPATTMFSIIVSIINMLIALPISFLFDFLLTKICAKWPDWGGWKWCGFITNHVEMHNDNQNGYTMLTMRSIVQDMIHMTPQMDSLLKILQKLTISLQQLIQIDKADVVSEMRVVLTKAQSYFDYPLAQRKRASVWELTQTRPGVSMLRLKWNRVLMYLGLKNSKDKITPHNLNSLKLQRLQQGLEKVREQSKAIVKSITGEDEVTETDATLEKKYSFSAILGMANLRKEDDIEEKEPIWDQEDGIDFNQDLLQHFILEQLSPLHRYALKRQCFAHDYLVPERIRAVYWVLAWVMVVGSMLFFIYWTFAWCVFSGNAAFKSWSNTLLANYLQDILLMQVVKVYVIYISTQGAVIPRLLVIQSTLENLAFQVYFQLEDVVHEYHNFRPVPSEYEDSTPSSPDLIDAELAQHFSPACRAARTASLRYLPASLLLQRVRDLDIYNCRRPPYTRPVGMLTLLLFALPILTELLLAEGLADTVFETVFNFLVTSVYAVVVFLFLQYTIMTILAICVFAIIWMSYSYYHYNLNRMEETRFVLRHFRDNMRRFQHHSRLLVSFVSALVTLIKHPFVQVWNHNEEEIECRIRNISIWAAMNMLDRVGEEGSHYQLKSLGLGLNEHFSAPDGVRQCVIPDLISSLMFSNHIDQQIADKVILKPPLTNKTEIDIRPKQAKIIPVVRPDDTTSLGGEKVFEENNNVEMFAEP